MKVRVLDGVVLLRRTIYFANHAPPGLSPLRFTILGVFQPLRFTTLSSLVLTDN